MLCPAQLRRRFIWSPSVPLSQFPPISPSDFRCPITGSTACRLCMHFLTRVVLTPRFCPLMLSLPSEKYPKVPIENSPVWGAPPTKKLLLFVTAIPAFTPNSWRPCAFPLEMHSTSGACRLYSLSFESLHRRFAAETL